MNQVSAAYNINNHIFPSFVFKCPNLTVLTSFVSLFSGYKAPEYASRGVYSLKTDVFSFGLLVLVIISGRKNTILDKQGDTIGVHEM